MSPSVEPELDRMIGKFRLLRTLGAGGMGKVYLARQEKLDRLVAIKVLHKEMAEDEVFLERFQREARAAAVFQHPNVVAVIDADEDPVTGEPFIAFEYVEGASLEDLVKVEPFKERNALEIMRDVVEALKYAESKGIVHRDIKPDNILIGADGVPKVADLGLAKTFDRGEDTQVTQEGVIVGTPLYMAPEQALGYEAVDIRADIYSLGLCLWRMLTGLVPFDEDGDTSSLHILSRHINEDLPDVRSRNSEVSEEVASLIRSMCARERDDRYATAQDLHEEICRILSGKELIGPSGAGDPQATRTLSAAHIQMTSSADTVVTGGKGSKTENMPAGWTPGSGKKKGGLAGKLFVLLLIVGLAAGGWHERDALKDLAAKIGRGDSAPVHTAATSAGTGGGDGNPLAGDGGNPLAGGGETDPETDGGDAGGTPTVVTPPKASSIRSPDINDESATVAHIQMTSQLLFAETAQGVEYLNALKLSKGWEHKAPIKRFVLAMDQAVRMVDPATNAATHEAAGKRLREIVEKQKKIIPGKLAAGVDRELGRWVKFVVGLGYLHRAIADPRAQKPALDALSEFPPKYQVKESAAALVKLTDTVDFYARWVGSTKRRVEVEMLRKNTLDELAGTAIGTALRNELLAMNSIVRQLTHDTQRSFVSAIYVVGQTENGARSEFVKARRREVPPNASLRNMPALGLLIELQQPWQTDEQALTVTINTRIKLRFSKKGYSDKSVRWGRQPTILVEPRSRDILLRLPDSTPGEFSRKFTSSGPSRFTVTKKKVQVKRVFVVLQPPRQ